MAVNKSENTIKAGQRIDILGDDQLREWSQHFGVTEEELRVAVWKVGLDATDVAEELLENRVASGYQAGTRPAISCPECERLQSLLALATELLVERELDVQRASVRIQPNLQQWEDLNTAAAKAKAAKAELEREHALHRATHAA